MRHVRIDRTDSAGTGFFVDPAVVRGRDPRRHRQSLRCGARWPVRGPGGESIGHDHPVNVQTGGAVFAAGGGVLCARTMETTRP